MKIKKSKRKNKSLKSETGVSQFLFHGSVPPCPHGSLPTWSTVMTGKLVMEQLFIQHRLEVIYVEPYIII